MPALRELFAQYDVEFDKDKNLEKGEQQIEKTRDELGRFVRQASRSERVLNRVVGPRFARSFQQVGRAIRRVAPHIRDATTAMAGFATAAGVGAAAGLQRIVSSTIESTREIDRWANRLNLSNGTLRTWTELAGEFGADIDDVTDAFKELQLKAQDAIQGGTEQAEVFEMMGISMSELRANVDDTEGLMRLFTQGLDRMTSSSERARVVDELMSDSGTRMIEVLTLGTGEIQRRREAITRAVGPTAELSRVVREHAQRVRLVTRRWERFKREITARILPVLGQIAEKISEFEEPARQMIQTIGRVIRETNLLKGALIGVAAVAVVGAALTIGSWGPMVAAFAGIALAVAGVAVAFDQVSRAINGSGGALQKFLEHEDRLGADGVEGIVLSLSDTWENMKQNIDNATGAVQGFLEAIQPLVDVLQFTWRLMGFVSGGAGLADTIREQILPEGVWGALRGAAQERVAEEREREIPERERRAFNQAVAGGETQGYRGVGLDISGQRMSVAEDAAIPKHLLPSAPSIPRTAAVAATRIPRQEQAPPQTVNVTSPWTLNFDIAEATDADEVRRVVTREMTQVQSQWISELESLISDQTEVGS